MYMCFFSHVPPILKWNDVTVLYDSSLTTTNPHTVLIISTNQRAIEIFISGYGIWMLLLSLCKVMSRNVSQDHDYFRRTEIPLSTSTNVDIYSSLFAWCSQAKDSHGLFSHHKSAEVDVHSHPHGCETPFCWPQLQHSRDYAWYRQHS